MCVLTWELVIVVVFTHLRMLGSRKLTKFPQPVSGRAGIQAPTLKLEVPVLFLSPHTLLKYKWMKIKILI